MKVRGQTALVLGALLVVATGCGKSFFAEGTSQKSEGYGNLTDGAPAAAQAVQASEQKSSDVKEEPAPQVEAEIEATTKEGSDTFNGNVASEELQKKPGWALACGGDLFANVFPKAVAEVAKLGLLGWGASADQGQQPQASKLGGDFLNDLDQCLDVDLVAEAKKGLQYVLVKFDKETKAVTEAKLFDQANFQANPADYNACARLAGAPRAQAQSEGIKAIVASSLLAEHASCGDGACCIKFR